MTRTKTKKLMMATRRMNMEKRTVKPETVTVGTFVADPTSDIAMDVAPIEEPTYEIAIQETPILRSTKQTTAEGTYVAGPRDGILITESEEVPFMSCGSMPQQSQVS
jgi:hypothetical protein